MDSSQADSNDQIRARVEKIPEIREAGFLPYAERYERTHSLAEARVLDDGHGGIRVAGRVVALRYFGKLAFGHLFDYSGKMQFAAQKNALGERFAQLKKLVDIGDFIGIEGEIMTTRTGEKTVNIVAWTFLSKALRPLPEKFHGVTDPELRLRRRYLDLIMSPESMTRFKKRSAVVAAIRNFLDHQGFVEIDTPVLTNKASGALATPFVTHHDALDMDVYLRIAPETYLKRAVAGGFERVYEFARSFRNEGVDSSHLPDFTLLEYYVAYWNYEDNMNFTETLIKDLLEKVNGGLELVYQGREISFGGVWPRMSFRDLVAEHTGIDIDRYPDRDGLLDAIRERGIALGEEDEIGNAQRGTILDMLYKKSCRPSLVNPTFLTHHPLELSPLARKSDRFPSRTDRFQLVVNGWEVVNAYSELVDPLDQAERFEAQARARAAGDTEAMEVDRDFLHCMEYGMPPMSGWGMGIDRMVALLTNATTLRDVVLFPLMKPEA